MKKLLSLLLGLAIILSTVSFVSAEETGEYSEYEPILIKSFLVMTNDDIKNYKKINNRNNPKNKGFSFDFFKENEPKRDPKDPFTESEKKTLKSLNEEDAKIYFDILTKTVAFPTTSVESPLIANLNLEKEGNIKIEVYDINGIVQETEVENGKNAEIKFSPDKAGLYKVKYIVDGFVVGIKEMTVQDVYSTSIYNIDHAFMPYVNEYGFSYAETKLNYNAPKKLKVTDGDAYYQFLKDLKENPEITKEKLMASLCYTEGAIIPVALKTANANIINYYATRERAEKLIADITENADSFIAFYEGKTDKDKFTGLTRKKLDKQKADKEKQEKETKNIVANNNIIEEPFMSFEEYCRNNEQSGNPSWKFYSEEEKREEYRKAKEKDYSSQRIPIPSGTYGYDRYGKCYVVYLMPDGSMKIKVNGVYTGEWYAHFSQCPEYDENKASWNPDDPNPTNTPENTPTEKPADPTNTPEDQTDPTVTPKPEDNKEQPETPAEPTEKPQEQPTTEPQPTEKPAEPTEAPAENPANPPAEQNNEQPADGDVNP